MNFCEYRLAASGSAVPGVAIVYRSQVGSPGVAASFRRPGAKLAAEQGNLAGVITVMRRKLPQHGMQGGLAGRLWRAGSHRRMPRIRTSPMANSLPTR